MSAMNFSKTPLALILGGLLLSGCAVGPDFLRPDSTLPEQYTETSGDQAAQVTTAAAINPEWWRLFEDEILNNLVQQSLENSQDLQAAVARLEAAEAAAREAGSSLFPSVDLTGNTVRNRASGETASGQQTGPLTYNDRRVALTISYELDLWGRIRRNTEAAEALAKASQFDRDVVRLTLTSQVTQTYLNLRSLDAQLQVSQESVQAWERTLKIVEARLDAGAASALELAQTQSALSGAQAQSNQIRRQRALAENQLALLVGKPGLKVVTMGDFRTLPMPPMPPVGLPSSLLEARPDIRQSEQQLVAANARIGVAKAAYFPTISLTGFLGSESAAMSDLFTNNAKIWSAGADLLLPIFNAGRIGAQVDQATAKQKEAVANYQKVLQTAFREVSDALVSLKELSDEEIALAAQVDAAKQAMSLAESRYEAGFSGLLEVLDAQRTVNGAQLTYFSTRKDRLSASVDLFKSLGGGWQSEEEASVAEGS